MNLQKNPRSVFPVNSIYLGNAAAGIMSKAVLNAVVAHLRRECEIGAGEALAEISDQRKEAYEHAAKLLNAHDDEIAFTDSGNAALASLLLTAQLQPGDHVLVDNNIWGGAIAMLSTLDGIVIDVLPSTKYGNVDIKQVRKTLHPRTKIVLITWCGATCGIMNPVHEIGTIVSDAGIPYIVDACQVVGQRKVDVQEIKCSALFASGRKWLRGPRGTALLYASRDYLAMTSPILLDQFGYQRHDARRYEKGEFNVSGQVGLAVAIKETLSHDLNASARHIQFLAQRLRVGIRAIDGIELLDDVEDAGPIVGFYSLTVSSVDMVHALKNAGVTVNLVSMSYAPVSPAADAVTAVVRAAPQIYNEKEEIDTVLEIIRRVLSR